MPELNWLTRSADLQAADAVPYRLLREVPELSDTARDPGTGNLLLEADNLEALKALLPFYAGQVKCIFIDPPYNTRSAFEHYDDNLEHTQWLSMMYPRLVLLRELLREDGSLWVTIDDNEAHYLKVILDEVFGRANFVANIVWQKRFAPNSTAQHLSDSHDHLLLFARQKNLWRRNLLPRTNTQNDSYKNPDNDPRGVWTSGDLSARNSYSAGIYPITSPSGRVISGPPRGLYWRVSKEKFLELEKDGRIWWGKSGSNVPRIKRFLSEVMDGVVPQTIWLHSEAGNTQEAKKESMAFIRSDDEVFQTPKPEKLIFAALSLATNPGDLVLDSFLGSGTTAAVAHKMNRRWIGIERGEHAVTHCGPRLRKVIAGEQGGISEAVGWQGGGGFRFFRLGPAIFLPDGSLDPAIGFGALAAHLWFAETGTPWSPETVAGGAGETPLLGVHEGTALYLLYNGILRDRQAGRGNVLTRALLLALPPHAGSRIVYGTRSALAKKTLDQLGIVFKQIPADIRAR